MYYKKLYAIYSSNEDFGYVTGISVIEGAKFLNTTRVLSETCQKNEIPIFAHLVASIKLFSDKQAAQEAIKELALCSNIPSVKTLVARELDDRELLMIDRCRRAVNEQNTAWSYLRQFKLRKLKCPSCSNKSVADMIVGETNYLVMSNETPILSEEQFQKQVKIYCNKCGEKIV